MLTVVVLFLKFNLFLKDYLKLLKNFDFVVACSFLLLHRRCFKDLRFSFSFNTGRTLLFDL